MIQERFIAMLIGKIQAEVVEQYHNFKQGEGLQDV